MSENIEQKVDELSRMLTEGFAAVAERFDRIDSTLDKTESHFEHIEGTLGSFESHFSKADSRFDRLEHKLGDLLQAIEVENAVLLSHDERLNKLEGLQTT